MNAKVQKKPVANGKTFTGQVVSDKMAKTIIVELRYKMSHPRYHKIIENSKKIYVDNNLDAKTGDTVLVRETRPISKTKRFTTLKIIK